MCRNVATIPGMHIQLRQATPDDFDFLYALHVATMREYVEQIWEWHDAWQEEYFARKFDPALHRVIVVDGRDAGTFVVEWRVDEVYVALIELLPVYQGRGIGSDLLRSLIAEAHGRGLPVTLHVLKPNTPARRLYERLGFRVVGDEEHRWRMLNPPTSPATP